MTDLRTLIAHYREIFVDENYGDSVGLSRNLFAALLDVAEAAETVGRASASFHVHGGTGYERVPRPVMAVLVAASDRLREAMEGADVPLAADWSGWRSPPAAGADEEAAICCLSLGCFSLTHPPGVKDCPILSRQSLDGSNCSGRAIFPPADAPRRAARDISVGAVDFARVTFRTLRAIASVAIRRK